MATAIASSYALGIGRSIKSRRNTFVRQNFVSIKLVLIIRYICILYIGIVTNRINGQNSFETSEDVDLKDSSLVRVQC